MTILIFFSTIFCAVTETFSGIGFDEPKEANLKNKENVIFRKNGIEMRDPTMGGSLITFKDVNPHDEWSFEFTIDNIQLDFPQMAGIYLWYTHQPPEFGKFNGISGQFHGMMAGMEILGRHVQLTLAENNGELNYDDTDDVAIMKDSPNPARFKNMKEIRFKVINTSKNFKIEIYDGDNLVYDNLRFQSFGHHNVTGKGGYFSITTVYENAPMSKSILLKKSRLTKRVESDDYDFSKQWSKPPANVPRYHDDIDHVDKQISHLISYVEGLLNYMRSMIGERSNGLSLYEGMSKVHENLEIFEKAIGELNGVADDKNDQIDSLQKFNKKLDESLRRLAVVNETVDNFEKIIIKMEERHHKNSVGYVVFFIIGVISFLVTTGIRKMHRNSLSRKNL